MIILVNNFYAFVSFVNLYVAIIVVLLEQNPYNKDCPIPVFSKRAVVIRELQFLYGGHREAFCFVIFSGPDEGEKVGKVGSSEGHPNQPIGARRGSNAATADAVIAVSPF